MRVVYADLLFLVNFSMDFLCLFIASRIMHRRLKPLRGITAAILGGAYSVAILFVEMGAFLSVAADITLCAIMSLAAFKSRGEGRHIYLMTTAVFFGASVCVGGLMTAMFSLLNRLDLPLREVEDNGDGISVWLFVILAMISGAAATFGGSVFKNVSSDTVLDVVVEYKDNRIRLVGMADTGNLLRDPISGRPIIIVDTADSVKLLGDKCTALAIKGNISAIVAEDNSHRVRLVPVSTASGSSSLCAFVPQKITLETKNGGAKEVDALFAPSKLSLGAEWRALGCGALIPASII